jgi:2-polyprenyl-3-methyl-5-hydroxy-6-metoxy-1,4-benzoquinol methylase
MTTRDLVSRLVEWGRANSVASIEAAVPYLEALAVAFGDREVRSVTAQELCAFHENVASPVARPVSSALDSKSRRWEAIYGCRSQKLLDFLPWESERPVRALVELLARPGFRPRRVLELGCGDGVNAVFLAGRGCQVTAVDISRSALELARGKQRAAGVEVRWVERDIFELRPPEQPYDFVFDRGMFHHVPVFHYESYKRLLAEQLAPGGTFHLICHHVSTRPTVVLDGLCGSIGKLLGFLSGVLVETGAGFTEEELREIFAERFRIESIEQIADDHNRRFRFLSAVMQRDGASA